MTNILFAETNVEFIEACKAAGIPPTSRQASKWRDRRGLAYQYKKVDRRHNSMRGRKLEGIHAK